MAASSACHVAADHTNYYSSLVSLVDLRQNDWTSSHPKKQYQLSQKTIVVADSAAQFSFNRNVAKSNGTASSAAFDSSTSELIKIPKKGNTNLTKSLTDSSHCHNSEAIDSSQHTAESAASYTSTTDMALTKIKHATSITLSMFCKQPVISNDFAKGLDFLKS